MDFLRTAGDGPMVVAVGQPGVQANGALESMTEILRSVDTRDLLVLTNLESPFTARWRRAGAEVLVAPRLWGATRGAAGRHVARPRQAWRTARTNVLAYRLFARLRAPLIHFNDPVSFACLGVAAKLAGMATTIDARLLVAPLPAFERVALLACDRVVALSDDMAARLAAMRWMPGLGDKVAVIPSGVDRDRLAAAAAFSAARWREHLGIDASAVAIGIVGPVSARKQQIEFVRRTVPAIDAAGDWRVHFLGDVAPSHEPYGRRFRAALAHSPHAARLSQPGFTTEIFGWYRALDLVVVTSTHEGLARAMIEAVSSGTPVVSFDVCSARGLLDEGCGVVVAAQDFEALARTLSELIDDPERRRAMGAVGARIAAQRFDARLTGRRYEELYAALRPARAAS